MNKLGITKCQASLDPLDFFINPATAFCSQTQTKMNLESVALQRFQDSSCGSFDWQLL
jgi:hypothetical protein